LKNSDLESRFMNDKSEGETRMSRNEKARQKSHADISESISFIHWSGAIDPSWEPGNSVLKDKVPRLDENGYMVYPLTLLERGLGQGHPDPSLRSEGIDIPLPRPEKTMVIQDRMGNGGIDPLSPHRLKVDAFEDWEHFFMSYPWAFRRPADESVLLPFERDYFDRKKMRQRQPSDEEYCRIAWLLASGVDEISAFDEVRGGYPPRGLDLDYEKLYLAGMLRSRQPYEFGGKPYFLPALPLSEQQRRDLDALLHAAVATKIEGPEWDRAFEEWQEKYPEWRPDGDEPEA
jgi:hypothetical protein